MGLKEWWRNRGRDFLRFPQDENGEVLWQMARNGDDLTKPRKMDFFFLFGEEKSAQQFCENVRQQGFDTALSYFDEKNSWDVECSIALLPTHAKVTEVEAKLDVTARAFGGKADGWGSMVQ